MKRLLILILPLFLLLSCNSVSTKNGGELSSLLEGEWFIDRDESGSFRVLSPDDFSDLARFKEGREGTLVLKTYFSVSSGNRELYGLYAGRIIAADEIYVNDQIVGRSGGFPPRWFNDWNKDRLYSIPSSMIEKGGINELKLRIYVNNEGQIDGKILFGDFKSVHSYYEIQRFIHRDINAVIVLVFLFFSFYNLFIYLRRKKDREFFWFALMTLLFSLNHSSLFITSIPGFDFQILSPLQWMKFYSITEFVFALSVLRFLETFGRLPQNRSRGVVIFILPFIILIFIMFHEDYAVLRNTLTLFGLSLLIPVLSLPFFILKKRGASDRIIPLVKFGYIPALLTVVHDILLPTLIPGYSLFIAGFGLPLFLMTTNIILAHEFVKDRDLVETMNMNLEDLVQARSRELAAATEKLNEMNRKDSFIEKFDLTPREKEIVRYILNGSSNDEISSSLSVSVRTINTHLYNLYKKLGVHSRVEIFSLFNNF